MQNPAMATGQRRAARATLEPARLHHVFMRIMAMAGRARIVLKYTATADASERRQKPAVAVVLTKRGYISPCPG